MVVQGGYLRLPSGPQNPRGSGLRLDLHEYRCISSSFVLLTRSFLGGFISKSRHQLPSQRTNLSFSIALTYLTPASTPDTHNQYRPAPGRDADHPARPRPGHPAVTFRPAPHRRQEPPRLHHQARFGANLFPGSLQSPGLLRGAGAVHGRQAPRGAPRGGTGAAGDAPSARHHRRYQGETGQSRTARGTDGGVQRCRHVQGTCV